MRRRSAIGFRCTGVGSVRRSPRASRRISHDSPIISCGSRTRPFRAISGNAEPVRDCGPCVEHTVTVAGCASCGQSRQEEEPTRSRCPFRWGPRQRQALCSAVADHGRPRAQQRVRWTVKKKSLIATARDADKYDATHQSCAARAAGGRIGIGTSSWSSGVEHIPLLYRRQMGKVERRSRRLQRWDNRGSVSLQHGCGE